MQTILGKVKSKLLIGLFVFVILLFILTSLPTDRNVLLSIFVLFAGVIVQAVYMSYDEEFNSKDLLKILTCIATSFLGFIPGRDERVYDFFFHCFFVMILFMIFYVNAFKKRLLKCINKATVSMWNLIFLYLFFQTHFLFFFVTFWIVMSLSLVVFCNLFFHFDRHSFWEIFLYIWFLIMLVYIGFSHFTIGNLSVFFNDGVTYNHSLLAMFFTGFTLMYIFVNAQFFLMLIPVTGKHQKFKDRIIEIKNDLKEFNEKYQDGPVETTTIYIIFIFGAFLFLNYYFNFINIVSLLPILITVLYFVDNYILSLKSNFIK